MLKVAKDDVRDGLEESVNAVILGEELNLEQNPKDKKKHIIFPLLIKPLNDIKGIHKSYYWAEEKQGDKRLNQAAYNSNRSNGKRKHAARDMYTPPFTPVVAIADGEVIGISSSFADGTGAVIVLHEIEDGRKFIIRYGEVENNTVSVKVRQKIKQRTVLGKTGFLRTWHKRIVSGYDIYMLHFEYFTGDLGYDLSSPLSTSDKPFKRRKDLADPLEILREGYENTFGKNKKQDNNNKWAHSKFGNLIAEKESRNNYNICNKTKIVNGRRKVFEVNDVLVIESTIAEIQKKQKNKKLFAVGRYQLIPNTLNEAVAALGLNTSEKLNKETQDRVFDKFLIDKKRPEIIAYLEGEGSVEDAMYAAAKEWASIGVEKGKKISGGKTASGGESYYDGDGLNKAHITPQKIKKALIDSKNENK